jgi:hypothetical protein
MRKLDRQSHRLSSHFSTTNPINNQRDENQHEKQKYIWQLQWALGIAPSFDDFPNPIAFPQDKQEPPKNRDPKPTVLVRLSGDGHSITFSHPSTPLLIKAVLSTESSDCPGLEPFSSTSPQPAL